MKKTLIALVAVAMATVAQAASYTHDAQTGIGTMTYTQSDFTNGSLTFAGYTLDQSADWTISGNITIGSGDYNEWGTAVFATGDEPTATSYDNGGAQLYVTKDDGLNIKVDGNDNNTSGVSTGLSYAAGSTLTFTLTFTTSDKKLLLSVNDKPYSDTLETGDAAISGLSTVIGKSSAAAGFITKDPAEGQTAWAINSITVSGTKVVPEPATATLSLLALAGLAARRRRK